jgi:hypothetical protein
MNKVGSRRVGLLVREFICRGRDFQSSSQRVLHYRETLINNHVFVWTISPYGKIIVLICEKVKLSL